MDRIAYIEQIASQGHWERYGLVHALTRCLDPDEAIALLLRSIYVPTSTRTAAIRKVCNHIASGRLVDPSAVITALMTRISNCEHRRRESVAYCLLEIARACDSASQRRVQEYLGASRYVGLRRRSYKLYAEEDGESRMLLERAWREHHDHEATWLIVKTFPTAFLVEEKNALLNSLTEGWQLSRLYFRLAETVPDILDELLALDPISYIYVAAKRGIRPPFEIIHQVLDLSLGDQRLGLLLWSIGEIGLWDVLENLSNRLTDLDAAQRSCFLERFPDVHGIL